MGLGIALVVLWYAAGREPEQVAKPPFALKATNWFDEGVPGTNPIVGIPKTPHGKYCTSIGYKTGETTTNFAVILLGNGANTTNDHELVIKFLDGTELRHALPTNTVVDFRGFPGWQDVK